MLWYYLFNLSEVISPLFSSSISNTHQPGAFIFQCHIFLPFHIVHGVRMKSEFLDVQADLEKAEEPEIKLTTFVGSLKRQRVQKNIYFCFIDCAKAFDCMDLHKLWKILKEMGIPDHLTCLLRHLYADQEATVRTRQGRTDWLSMAKGVHQDCLLSPCLFNLYAEYIMNEDNGNLIQKVPCLPFCTQCPQHCSRPLLTHTSARDSWTLTVKSGSVSCGVTAPFSCVLVHSRFCLCLPRVCFPSSV